jgi:hypothetical protein
VATATPRLPCCSAGCTWRASSGCTRTTILRESPARFRPERTSAKNASGEVESSASSTRRATWKPSSSAPERACSASRSACSPSTSTAWATRCSASARSAASCSTVAPAGGGCSGSRRDPGRAPGARTACSGWADGAGTTVKKAGRISAPPATAETPVRKAGGRSGAGMGPGRG